MHVAQELKRKTVSCVYWRVFPETSEKSENKFINSPGKRRKSKRGGGGGGGGGKKKDLDPDVIIETQEFDYIEVKRIVQSHVKTAILHVREPLEPWNKDVNYFYFVRRTDTPIGE